MLRVPAGRRGPGCIGRTAAAQPAPGTRRARHRVREEARAEHRPDAVPAHDGCTGCAAGYTAEHRYRPARAGAACRRERAGTGSMTPKIVSATAEAN